MATATTERLGNYLETFSEFEKRTTQQPSWLRSLRQKGFARFCETGFPTPKDEDWRFTNVSAIARTDFQLARAAAPVAASEAERFRIAGAACRLVFVNGQFAPQLSDTTRLPEGVEVGGVAEKISRDPGKLEPHLGRYVNIQRDAFCALNTALFEDGAYIYLQRRTVLERPIHLLFVSVSGADPRMAHPHNLIVAEAEAQANVVEDYISLAPHDAPRRRGAGVPQAGSSPFFTNVVTELVAGEGAVISHTMIEREDTQAYNVSTLRMQQARDANLSSHSVLLGGALVRNNVHPVLAGEGGECLINGLFIGRGRQHMDNYMLVEHASPHCSSRQFYNGILDEQSHGVFHGRIIVHKDAQKTDAKQTNRNLLLSDDAQIDTKPQLEIYADDVKCTHGATIGQVEENALFYMRSRGIDEQSARRLLLFAFASECLERMKSAEVREYLEKTVQGWLPQGGQKPTGTQSERRWEEVG